MGGYRLKDRSILDLHRAGMSLYTNKCLQSIKNSRVPTYAESKLWYALACGCNTQDDLQLLFCPAEKLIDDTINGALANNCTYDKKNHLVKWSGNMAGNIMRSALEKLRVNLHVLTCKGVVYADMPADDKQKTRGRRVELATIDAMYKALEANGKAGVYRLEHIGEHTGKGWRDIAVYNITTGARVALVECKGRQGRFEAEIEPERIKARNELPKNSCEG